MYAYKVGYWEHDGGHDVVLFHPKAFSQEDFENLVADAFLKAIPLHRAMEEREHQEHNQYNEALAQEALANKDFMNYAEAKCELEQPFCPRLGFDNILDRYNSQEDLDTDVEAPSVVDILISDYGFLRPTYHAKAFGYGLRHLGEPPREVDASEYTSLELKIFDRVRKHTNLHEENINAWSYDQRCKRINELLDEAGAPSTLNEDSYRDVSKRIEYLRTVLEKAFAEE